jgi:hypothetical protein
MVRHLRRWLLILGALVLLAAMGFVIWASTPLGPMEEAEASFQSDEAVSVTSDGWYLFEPVGIEPSVGLILYPGGRVDPRSYGPLARGISAAGFVTAITPMPLNLAVLAPDQAMKVIDSLPAISTWVVGGHSLGGAMAAEFAFRHPEAVGGLVLLAAYPASSTDLSGSGIRVLSLYGTLDGVAEHATLEASRARLPADTIWMPIEGGNHAQFGWYGDQPGDQPATLSREIQQVDTVRAIVSLLTYLGAGDS